MLEWCPWEQNILVDYLSHTIKMSHHLYGLKRHFFGPSTIAGAPTRSTGLPHWATVRDPGSIRNIPTPSRGGRTLSASPGQERATGCSLQSLRLRELSTTSTPPRELARSSCQNPSDRIGEPSSARARAGPTTLSGPFPLFAVGRPNMCTRCQLLVPPKPVLAVHVDCWNWPDAH